MNIPYGELMKYRNHPETAPIYSYPIFTDHRVVIQSIMMKDTNIIDLGCGKGDFYNQVLLPSGYKGEYVGIDPDPSLGDVGFPVFKSIDEFLDAGYRLAHFDVLMMLNLAEHLTPEELYEYVYKLNPYVDGNIVILTPNAKCFDYMFVDPQHKRFYSHEFLYGFCKHFGFENINMWRGQGYHQIRENVYNQDSTKTDLMDMNKMQRQVCLAMGLDWYGNLMLIGERVPLGEKDAENTTS